MGRIHEALQQAGVRDASKIGTSRADDGDTFRAAWPSVDDVSAPADDTKTQTSLDFPQRPRVESAGGAANQRRMGRTAGHIRERQPRGGRAVPPACRHAARRAERDQFAQSAARDERRARRRQDVYRRQPGADVERVVSAARAARRHGLPPAVAQQHHRRQADAWSRRGIEIAVRTKAAGAAHFRALDVAAGGSTRDGSDEQSDLAADATGA